MKFEPLTTEHVAALLDFELTNKAWFESVIAPRNDDFYSLQGVNKHIAETLEQVSKNTFFSGVMTDNGVIIARANLKDISTDLAYVGYRVGKDALSKGIATKCLVELINKAKKMGVRTLKAQVLTNNPASARVLEKQGFIEVETIENFCLINSQEFDCRIFSKTLDR